jgi:hypothetical protein
VADADFAREPAPAASNCSAVQHLLAAVRQAISLPAPLRHSDRLPYLVLLERRARAAAASIDRLLADPRSSDLDFLSEGDHILHQIADMLPLSYRHQPEEC